MKKYLMPVFTNLIESLPDEITDSMSCSFGEEIKIKYNELPFLTIGSNAICIFYGFADGNYEDTEADAIQYIIETLIELPHGLRPNFDKRIKFTLPEYGKEFKMFNLYVDMVDANLLYLIDSESYFFEGSLYKRGTYQTLCERIDSYFKPSLSE